MTTASELIKELQEHIDKYGDMPVCVRVKEKSTDESYDEESFFVFDTERKDAFFNNEWHDNLKYLVIEPW